VIVLTVHKLIALGLIALVAVTVNRLRRDAGISGLTLGAVIATGALFLAAIASGGLLSTDKPPHPAVRILHQATPYLSALLTAALLLLMTQGRP
jgi:hypothetical protein